MIRHVIHLIQERALLNGGCIYVNGRRAVAMEEILVRLLKSVRNDKSKYFKRF